MSCRRVRFLAVLLAPLLCLTFASQPLLAQAAATAEKKEGKKSPKGKKKDAANEDVKPEAKEGKEEP